MSTKFIEVPAWKKLVGMEPTEKFQVNRNKETGAFSIVLPNGDFYKCEKGFDAKLPHCFLVPDGVLDESCLINYDASKAKLEAVVSL